MKYSILKNNFFELNDYSLTTLRKKDIFLILKWRNQQKDVLRQNNTISKKQQIEYYQKFIQPSYISKRPRIMLFSYLYHKNCIGYGGLTNIDWDSKRAELSFLIDTKIAKDKKKYSEKFSNYLKIIEFITFKELKLNRLFTETYDFRKDHIEILERNGFIKEGVLKKHVYVKNKFHDSLIHAKLKKNFKNNPKIYVEK